MSPSLEERGEPSAACGARLSRAPPDPSKIIFASNHRADSRSPAFERAHQTSCRLQPVRHYGGSRPPFATADILTLRNCIHSPPALSLHPFLPSPNTFPNLLAVDR